MNDELLLAAAVLALTAVLAAIGAFTAPADAATSRVTSTSACGLLAGAAKPGVRCRQRTSRVSPHARRGAAPRGLVAALRQRTGTRRCGLGSTVGAVAVQAARG